MGIYEVERVVCKRNQGGNVEFFYSVEELFFNRKHGITGAFNALLAYYAYFLPAIAVWRRTFTYYYYSREFQNQSTILPNGLR